MRTLITLLLLQISFFSVCKAQSKPGIAGFGEIDLADLQLSACPYEPDANAEILFDYADINTTLDSLTMVRHKRIKIYNSNATDLASIKFTYHSRGKYEDIPFIEAQTIQLSDNGKVVISKVDTKLIYTQAIDKNTKTVVFTFPNVKPGCIIEYRYKFKTTSPANFPTWFFQSDIPTRYSELAVTISKELDYNLLKNGKQPFVKDTSETITIKKNKTSERYYWAKSNVRSFSIEPYMPTGNLNLQYLQFQLHAVSAYGRTVQAQDTWIQIISTLMRDPDFYEQLDQNLSKQDTVIEHAQRFTTSDAKISYLFNWVKQNIKWNDMDGIYPDVGIKKAWSQKKGSSSEINIILYNFLTKSGVSSYPLLVSTRSNGQLSGNLASFSQLNKVAIYIPIDSTRFYVLDASNKYNVYNELPASMLNTQGIQVFPKNRFGSKFINLKNDKPATQTVAVDAEIKPDGTVTGIAKLSVVSYARAEVLEALDLIGQKKLEESLSEGANNIKVTKLEFENMTVDTLPLVQNISFNMESPGSDDTYIYFNPNAFTPLQTNPFTNPERVADVDLVYTTLFVMNGQYKLPAGYKIDILPKNSRISTEDKGIVFSRAQEINNGYLNINCIISIKRSEYTVDEYPGLYQAYKTMFDLLNTPVVLKKAL